jgi:predicted dehydrogenase
MSETVRVGVIGTGWYADWMHLPNLKSHPKAEVVALCGRNPERAAETARKYAIPQVFSDYREMIEKAGLHALVVAAPDDMHYPITMDALDAGLHVLCEKPLARTAAQAREMAEKAAAKGVKNMVFFTLRWMPAHRYLRELIEAGYIGRCYHCHIRHYMSYGRSGGYGWRFDPQRGHGALGDLGSHAIDLARWYVGDIIGVSAQLDNFVERRDASGNRVEAACDAALLSVRFADGAQGTLHASVVAHTGERMIQQQIALYGEGGTLEADHSLLRMEVRGVRQGETSFQGLPVPDRFWGDADRNDPFSVLTRLSVGDRQFIEAILEDRPIAPDFRDGWKVQQIMEAAEESAPSGDWVSLEV